MSSNVSCFILEMEVSEKNRRHNRHTRTETQKIVIVFFGVCTGVILWLALDFRDESVFVHSKTNWKSENVNYTGTINNEKKFQIPYRGDRI